MATEEQWHQFEALRDDGAPAMFRIRDMAPRPDQPKIFVVELPYPITDLSRLPDATSYRRIATFEENWLIPAAGSLGWSFVAAKIDDGSCFLYLYGASDPTPMIERLAPFDGGLGFFDESDPEWDEYAALKELLDEANAIPTPVEDEDVATTLRAVSDEDRATTIRPASEAAAKVIAKLGRPAAPTIPIANTKVRSTPGASTKPQAPANPKAAAKAAATRTAATKAAATKAKPASKAAATKAATKAGIKATATKAAASKPAIKAAATKAASKAVASKAAIKAAATKAATRAPAPKAAVKAKTPAGKKRR
jgi:hypothetical protein